MIFYTILEHVACSGSFIVFQRNQILLIVPYSPINEKIFGLFFKMRKERGWFGNVRWIHIKGTVLIDDNESKTTKTHLLLLPETHKILNCSELAPGGSIQFKNILTSEQADIIGPGVQSYLVNLQNTGIIQVILGLFYQRCILRSRNMESRTREMETR